ncbi:protein CDV3 homolog [Anneissia japonica]|uniref:protein CDV3 homolog n=1 Tax=Anneissia japonica TaxID=1529436 RepID=UPI001425593D|nr:protein CDV3 homolog [Anneissia japonica]
MTDKSVEDFFAKKDKNKRSKSKSNKSKFTTSDQIAKTLSTNTTTADGEKKESKKEKKPAQVSAIVTDEVGEDNATKPANEIPQADDEWKDFEDPTTKDYSGLRIQSLQIGYLCINFYFSVKFNINKYLPEQPTVDVVEKPAPEPVAPPAAPEPEPPKSNKYIPPAKRAGAMAEQMPSSTPANDRFRRRKKVVAPEINSESDFPSLSASIDIAKYKTKESERDFETVTKGSRGGEDPTKKSSQIEIQNKYAALQQN